MIRILTLVAAFCGALAFSQFPAFSQQYLQRLSGAVEELSTIVVAFDLSARGAGLSRSEALARLEGDVFEQSLQTTFADAIIRYERLRRDEQALRGQGPVMRLLRPWRFRDTALLQATWADFRPALILGHDGVICGALGLVVGWFLAYWLGAIPRWFWRRRPRRL